MKSKNVIISLFSALIVSIAYIVVENQPSSLYDDMDFFTKIYISSDTTRANTDSALFIDVVYDKTVITYKQDGDSVNGFIVDRKKLLDFLTLVDSIDTYKGIFLDITFDKRQKTDYDDQLLKQIINMNRKGKCVYVVKIDDEETDIDFDTRFDPVAVHNYYMTSKTNLGYVRQIYKKDSRNNLASLSLYNHTHYDSPITPRPLWWFTTIYTCNGGFFDGGVFRNNPILKIPQPTIDKYHYDYRLYRFMSFPKTYIADVINGRLLFVGDFVTDRHDTYAGKMSGSYLTYNAFKALEEHKHVLTWFFLLCMFAVYFILTLFITENWLIRIVDYMQNQIVNQLRRWNGEKNTSFSKLFTSIISFFLIVLDFISSYVTPVLVFFLIFIYLYNQCDFMYSSTIPILYFTVFKIVWTTYLSFNKHLYKK